MKLKIEIELERRSGKFASKDALFDDIRGTLQGETLWIDEAEYEITDVALVS